MKIGIDMRMAGTGEGIGRYVEELVKHLTVLDKKNLYSLICNDDFPDPPVGHGILNFEFPNNFKMQKVKSKYYSWSEQTKLVRELKKLNLDLIHFPNFNAPILYPGKFVITIHDIIHHHFPGKKKSRFFHRLAYRATIRSAARAASRIIAVSQATKEDILKTFKVPPEKVEVVYEGVKKAFFDRLDQEVVDKTLSKFDITKPYLLFVGVWRQYKNLPQLALAFDILKEKFSLDIQLVLAGKIDPFYPEIKRRVMSIKNANDVRALGYVEDEDLGALYERAKVFVLPSLVEGFGLIGVEAQAAGTVVAASDIPVLREILGEGALLFDPKNEHDIAEKISNAFLSDCASLRNLGLANAKRFDWQEAARKTLKIYEEATERT